MLKIQQNKLVLFGAGKIGRSFIGQLFSRSGYEVVFIDISREIIDALNRERRYRVIIKADKDEVLEIENVRGVHSEDTEKVVVEIATAGIGAVSVGLHGLGGAVEMIAAGLMRRKEEGSNEPLDIIIAENMRNADSWFAENLKKHLPPGFPLNEMTGLIETSIGKMVPIMLKKDVGEDVLQVFAEPYNTLILNKKAFKNPIPAISGLAPKDNMKAWVDRKLFIHNLGHSSAAYLGFILNPSFIHLYEALAVPGLHSRVRATMLQAADILLKLYPLEFTVQDLTEHIDDLLFRFQNKALGDTIFRVGCDLFRKLGPYDRLAGALRLALELNLPYNLILDSIVAGCHFRAKDENGLMLGEDAVFSGRYRNDIRRVLKEICCFDESIYSSLYDEAEKLNLKIMN